MSRYDGKKMVLLGLRPEDHQIIHEAARRLGVPATKFVTRAAIKAALGVIHDRRRIQTD